jgi:hypothetical protein
MKIRPGVLALAAVLVSLCASDLRAQEPTAIRGQVTSRDSGAPIAGATVAIPSLNLSTVTDQDGRYVLPVPVDSRPPAMFSGPAKPTPGLPTPSEG